MSRELYKVTQEIIKLFNLNSIQDFGDYIQKQIDDGKYEQLVTQYKTWLGDDDEDWLQAIFQYNMADRDKKKQDYTPPCLSKLLAEMIKREPNTIYDVCCGSGSLTIQVAKRYPKAEYILHELDENVIPYLILNLTIHNIKATVIHGDCLTGEVWNCYRIDGVNIEKVEDYNVAKYDVVISNPPFNLKNNGNVKFLKIVTEHSLSQGLIILHKPPIQTQSETEYMQELIDKHLLHRIIYNSDKLFTSTPTSTSILEINHNKADSDLTLQDCTYYHEEITRHQNGQYGGKSHTKRTYHKKFNYYTDEQIQNIANVWIGPRTVQRNLDYLNADEIPLSLMTPDMYGHLYGDSEEVTERMRLEEENKRQKEKERYNRAMEELYKNFKESGLTAKQLLTLINGGDKQ